MSRAHHANGIMVLPQLCGAFANRGTRNKALVASNMPARSGLSQKGIWRDAIIRLGFSAFNVSLGDEISN